MKFSRKRIAAITPPSSTEPGIRAGSEVGKGCTAPLPNNNCGTRSVDESCGPSSQDQMYPVHIAAAVDSTHRIRTSLRPLRGDSPCPGSSMPWLSHIPSVRNLIMHYLCTIWDHTSCPSAEGRTSRFQCRMVPPRPKSRGPAIGQFPPTRLPSTRPYSEFGSRSAPNPPMKPALSNTPPTS